MKDRPYLRKNDGEDEAVEKASVTRAKTGVNIDDIINYTVLIAGVAAIAALLAILGKQSMVLLILAAPAALFCALLMWVGYTREWRPMAARIIAIAGGLWGLLIGAAILTVMKFFNTL